MLFELIFQAATGRIYNPLQYDFQRYRSNEITFLSNSSSSAVFLGVFILSDECPRVSLKYFWKESNFLCRSSALKNNIWSKYSLCTDPTNLSMNGWESGWPGTVFISLISKILRFACHRWNSNSGLLSTIRGHPNRRFLDLISTMTRISSGEGPFGTDLPLGAR